MRWELCDEDGAELRRRVAAEPRALPRDHCHAVLLAAGASR